MSRHSSKSFSIGDCFLTWQVIGPDESKKYKYICKCTECGAERSFNKYNLLRGSFAPCKKCAHIKLKNINLIKKHWNCELNKAIFTKPQDFNLAKSYWFICQNGHNFKSSIKDFSFERCMSCKNEIKNNSSKVQAVQFALEYFTSIFPQVIINEELNLITILNNNCDFVADIIFNEEDYFSNYRNYFKNEEEYLKAFTDFKCAESASLAKGHEFIHFQVKNNLKDNVDNLKTLVLQLAHTN